MDVYAIDLGGWLAAQTPSPTPSPGAGSGTSSTFYTVLGAAIAGTATLLAVALKFLLDGRAERERHAREIEKLRLQLAEQRFDVLQENRRKLFAALLVATHAIYGEIVRIRRRRRREEIDDAAYTALLRAISGAECQAAIEESRLLASADTSACADALWQHLRSGEVPQGTQLASGHWVAWKNEYWRLRHELIACCKEDLGSAVSEPADAIAASPLRGPTEESR